MVVTLPAVAQGTDDDAGAASLAMGNSAIFIDHNG
jgi:hypothetical protein